MRALRLNSLELGSIGESREEERGETREECIRFRSRVGYKLESLLSFIEASRKQSSG